MGDFSTALEMTKQCTIHNAQCTIKRTRGAFLCPVEIAASPCGLLAMTAKRQFSRNLL
ncbi:MAG: hypothetical protein LBL66_10800 [Clostridiales bacterium]|nr:hypothetical protein [Clostridiales bacterium]